MIKRKALIKGGMRMMGIMKKTLPHSRVCHNVQKDRPVNNILGDIKKGVTIRSRVINFCEHYLFISSFDHFNVEDILHDPNWVVVM
jgi:hypothetical protein